jgi:hypothetical protein
MTLSRPFIIAQSQCTLPSVNLEFDHSCPDVPSPITQIRLQYELFETIFKVLPLNNEPLSCETALAVKERIDAWFQSLPVVFRAGNPDQKFDNTHKFLVRHRLQTLCMGYAMLLTVVRPYMTRNEAPSSPSEIQISAQLRCTAVDTTLVLMDISKSLFDMFIPNSPKYHIVVFVPFDSAALMCSALIRDVEKTLPRRRELLQAIGTAISMISIMKTMTKTGSIAWNVLSILVPKLKLTESEEFIVDPEGSILKRRKTAKRAALSNQSGKGYIQTQTQKPSPSSEMTNSSDGIIPDFEWQLDPGQALEFIPAGEFDLSVLEPVWGWDDINFSLDDPELNFSHQQPLTF